MFRRYPRTHFRSRNINICIVPGTSRKAGLDWDLPPPVLTPVGASGTLDSIRKRLAAFNSARAIVPKNYRANLFWSPISNPPQYLS